MVNAAVSNILECECETPPSPQPHISIEYTCGTADPDNIRMKNKDRKVTLFDNYGIQINLLSGSLALLFSLFIDGPGRQHHKYPNILRVQKESLCE